MTIIDIAKKAGVSTATVSRVINNQGNVSPKTKKLVESVMESEGYVPNMLARGMIQKKTKTIGILSPVVIDTVIARYMSVLEYGLRENGFNTLFICNTGRETDKTPFLEELLGRMVDAVIIIGCSMTEHNDPKAFSVASGRIPVMVVNGWVPAENVYSIFCDERGAIRDITSEMIKKGKRRILYVYDTETFSGYQKISGYRDALASAGIEEDSRLLLRHVPDTDIRPTARAGALELVNEALRQGIHFDGVITADDILAAGVIESLRNNGIQPGGEIPVAGFNNGPIAECTYPKLTSIDNLGEEMCLLAVSHLLDVLNKKMAMKKIVTTYRIAERDSFVFHDKD